MTDNLGDIFPDYASCPNFASVSKITVSDLLHMRSGLIDYVNYPDLFLGEERIYELFGPDPASVPYPEAYRKMEAVINDDLFLELIFSNELTGEPGAEYVYNNSNYHLLALIVEKVSGKSYEEYVDEVIFEPCKMDSSSAVSSGDVTASYTYDPELDYLSDPEFLMGAGDIHTSAVDMLKFDRALFGGCLLNEDSLKELFDPVDGYACGWAVEGDRIYHYGAIPRFLAANCIIDKDGSRFYIIVLSNYGEDHREMLIKNLERMIG